MSKEAWKIFAKWASKERRATRSEVEALKWGFYGGAKVSWALSTMQEDIIKLKGQRSGGVKRKIKNKNIQKWKEKITKGGVNQRTRPWKRMEMLAEPSETKGRWNNNNEGVDLDSKKRAIVFYSGLWLMNVTLYLAAIAETKGTREGNYYFYSNESRCGFEE